MERGLVGAIEKIFQYKSAIQIELNKIQKKKKLKERKKNGLFLLCVNKAVNVE